ncbi:SRPBCC family protein [Saccharothrix lopnurensis]|uniref:SRPBCC family protein n=1 Tax=Saccharothrix lopnurensis TaxID=1670621 RepID=A0ABW1PBR2_9PSEU
MSETTTTLLGQASRTRREARLERVLPGTPDAVWAAWTDPALLPSWFGPVLAGVPGPDQEYVLEGRGDHGDTITCRVLRWREPELLEHTWRYIGESADSVLRVEISPAGDGTLLRLRHGDLPPEVDPADYCAGWHMYTDAMEARLQGREPVADSDARWLELLPAYSAAAE